MGVANHLFYRQDPEKQTLHRRITPTSDQYNEQRERWNSVAEYLRADLKVMSGCSVRTWLQGSYKFGTQIRPMGNVREFDVDLGVYFEWKEGADAYGKPHSPDDIRLFTQESLAALDIDDAIEVLDPPKPRCMRIRFAGNFHIDVPVYHLESGRDLRRLAVDGNSWEYSDPKAIYVWFVEQFDDQKRAVARRMIQYLKCWAALRFTAGEGPASILLTVLVGELLPNVPDDLLGSDDEAFHAIVQAIKLRLGMNREVPNPVDISESLTLRMGGGALDGFVEALEELAERAEAALDEEDLLEASDLWSKIFKHFFPMPEPEDVEKSVAETNQALANVTTPEIFVRATPRANPKRVFEGHNELMNIPRECDIEFRVTNMGAFPMDSVVEWTVRNEGSEAEYVNDLGHPAGHGQVARESSAYLGTHFMDCVVRHHGRIVGARRVPVRITGLPIPRRNPPRPAYVKLRRKRR